MPELARHALAQRVHVAELPGRVDVQQRERRRRRVEGLRARCSITALSLPIEYSITGLSASATTSRMMWMLSASRRCRWVSEGAVRSWDRWGLTVERGQPGQGGRLRVTSSISDARSICDEPGVTCLGMLAHDDGLRTCRFVPAQVHAISVAASQWSRGRSAGYRRRPRRTADRAGRGRRTGCWPCVPTSRRPGGRSTRERSALRRRRR